MSGQTCEKCDKEATAVYRTNSGEQALCNEHLAEAAKADVEPLRKPEEGNE